MTARDVLVIVATHLEAERLPALPGVRVAVSGIGAVNAALATQAALLEVRPRLAVSVGIAGAYPWNDLDVGAVVASSRMVYANLGAEDGEDFLDLERLGFPLLERPQPVFNAFDAPSAALEFARLAACNYGEVLTVETVTGSARTLERLRRTYPQALAEAMEGAGVAHAAARYGVPALEIRAISNPVLPRRDRTTWNIKAALEALNRALEAGWSALLEG
jgi:futalosine hydrolase